MLAGAANSGEETAVQAPCDATLLRIFIGHDDTFEGRPLYDQIVLRARTMGLSGAMVTRGILSFGPASEEHRIILRQTEDLPILIEIVDSEDRIREFLAVVDPMIGSGMVTTENVRVHRYGRRRGAAPSV
jgi:PII-like signaling protein